MMDENERLNVNQTALVNLRETGQGVDQLRAILEFKAKEKPIERWREDQLFQFLKLLEEFVSELERAQIEKRIMQTAWLVRNLLELRVWISYCKTSDENGKRFSQDALQDLDGYIAAVAKLELVAGVKNTAKELREQLAKFGQQLGMDDLDDDYKSVSDAARELHQQKEFLAENKILSKLAHPTALAMELALPCNSQDRIRETFLVNGVRYAIECYQELLESLVILYPDLRSGNIPKPPIVPIP